MAVSHDRCLYVALAGLAFITAQPALSRVQESRTAGEEDRTSMHLPAMAPPVPLNSSEQSYDGPLAFCAAEFDQQTLPVVDAQDIVAEQLRKTIHDTPEKALREKLRQAYLRYLGCR